MDKLVQRSEKNKVTVQLSFGSLNVQTTLSFICDSTSKCVNPYTVELSNCLRHDFRRAFSRRVRDFLRDLASRERASVELAHSPAGGRRRAIKNSRFNLTEDEPSRAEDHAGTGRRLSRTVGPGYSGGTGEKRERSWDNGVTKVAERDSCPQQARGAKQPPQKNFYDEQTQKWVSKQTDDCFLMRNRCPSRGKR